MDLSSISGTAIVAIVLIATMFVFMLMALRSPEDREFNTTYLLHATSNAAGRTLAAWVSPAVTQVTSVDVTDDFETVDFSWSKDMDEQELAWHRIMLLLAGAAGEMSASGGNIRGHLHTPYFHTAEQLAYKMIDAGNTEPPWPHSGNPSFGVSIMFEDISANPNEKQRLMLHIIENCFEKTMMLIQDHTLAFSRLGGELAEKRSLNEDEIRTLLGNLI